MLDRSAAADRQDTLRTSETDEVFAGTKITITRKRLPGDRAGEGWHTGGRGLPQAGRLKIELSPPSPMGRGARGGKGVIA